MIWINFIPLIFAGILLAKWELDKRRYNRKYHIAYVKGVEFGMRSSAAQWEQEIQLLAESAITKLKEKYPVDIKVVSEKKPFSVDFDTGKTILNYRICKLPRMHIWISLQPVSKDFFSEYEKYEGEWEKERGGL